MAAMNEEAEDAAHPLSPTFRIAAIAGSVEAVRLHIARGDDLNARDANGLTPLMLACSRNKIDVACLLLDAGADQRLVTPSGKSAFDFANEAGATELISLLTSAPHTPPAELSNDSAAAASADTQTRGQGDDSEPDGWNPEDAPVAPPDEPSIREQLETTQAAIRHHIPRDDSVAWDDVDALLPERASQLLGPDDPEATSRLRVLFLRALREGSVPDYLVNDLARSSEGERNPEAAQALRLAIRELGAETDERFEFATPWEDFRVHVSPDEQPDEEAMVSDAIAFAESLASPRNEPLRIYQHEFQSLPLLTADEEVALGKAMELGIAKACDSLAGWSEGMQYVIDACEMVVAGTRSIRWLRTGGIDVPYLPEDTEDAEEMPTILDPEDAPDELDDAKTDAATAVADVECESLSSRVAVSDELMEIASVAERLRMHSCNPDATIADKRDLLRSLSLSRGFLLDLLNLANSSRGRPASDFRAGMATYLRAREAMVRGNLKLAFFHARKQLFTGMDLADLAQEANLGLIRAVDKFDWRRGHRFSTYATWWIRQSVTRSVGDDSRLIRLPVHVHEKVQKANRVARQVELATGRAASPAEIAKRLDVPVTKAIRWLRISQLPESIDEADLESRMAPDELERFTTPDPAEALGRIEKVALINAALASLKPKEEQVIRMRFGIGYGDSMTLEEAGIRLGFTRERARQIENAALKRLRNSECLGILAGTPRESAEPQAKSAKIETDNIDAAGMPRPAGARVAPATRVNRLKQVLDKARSEGLTVVDERDEGGHVWVHIIDPATKGQRRLLRELLRLRFELWPGKGYWR